jgi:hypothetical protein
MDCLPQGAGRMGRYGGKVIHLIAPYAGIQPVRDKPDYHVVGMRPSGIGKY